MKPESKFIAYGDLVAWLGDVASRMRLVVPRAEGSAVVYRDFDPALPLELTRKATESAKHVLFPRSEPLLAYEKNKPSFVLAKLGAETPDDVAATPLLALSEPEDPKPTVVFGLLGCDAGGVGTFDPVFGGRRFPDPYYLKKRNATILIARACSEVLHTCFCHWVGGDPANRRDADILATDIGDGWLLEPLADRAAAVLDAALLTTAAAKQQKAAAERHAAARAALSPAPDLHNAEASLLGCFNNTDFWREQAAGCLACGICTYLCPTCHCFSITDESSGQTGVRLRSWDTCMSALYTLEASGHNPRPTKAERLRNRIGHKFSYFVGNHDGRISCCGCGRCIKSCPSSVDIREIVLAALAQESKEAAHG